jgi:uncharacterized protein
MTDAGAVPRHNVGGVTSPLNVRRLTCVDELRAVIGEPAAIVRTKLADSLNPLTRPYIERSPFLCIATSDADGNCDVSPRGDPRGFVRILGDRTLLIPERPGNRLADALRNIIANPHVGLLFFLPGIGETFRVNGRAWLTDDQDLLAESVHAGKVPKLGIVVEIDEAYTQCPKAFIRSELWNPNAFQTTDGLPSGGELLAYLNAAADPTFDGTEYDAARAARYARGEGMY